MVTKQEAQGFLSNVAGDRLFWVNDGHTIANLEGLANELKSMDNKTFKHHVNKEKNDFSNWVNDVVGDKELASDLRKAKTKPAAMKKVQERVDFLKKKAK